MSWQRKLGWSAGIVMVILLFASVAGYLYLRSSSFQQLALRKIAEAADTATGGKVQIRGMDFKLSTLTAHLYDITLRGTESPEEPPLVHADELSVQLKIVSAFHRQVTLRELLIEHPVVHIQVSRDGRINFPTPPPSNSTGTTSVFDMAVSHVQISGGEIDYKDRKTPLDADLHNLGTEVHFEAANKRYAGTLSYQNGSLRYAEYSPLPHNLELQFAADPQRFDINSAVLNLGSSSISLSAGMSNYSQPVADGHYTIRIHTQDFAKFSPTASPAGDVVLVGTIGYRPIEDQPLLRALSIDGKLASDLVTVAASGKRVEARNVHAMYRLAGGNLEVANFGLQTMGGAVAGKFAMKNIDTEPESTMHAALENISLKSIQRQLGRQTQQTAELSGQLRGTADASWKASISNLRAKADVFLQARANSKVNSGQEVPINGALHLAYDGPRQTVEVRDTTIEIPSATLNAQGTVSNHSSLQMQVVATDLSKLARLATSFQSTPGTVPSVSGSATLSAVVRGAVREPTIAVQLNGQDLHVEGSEWKSARFNLRADHSRLVVDHAEILNAQQGQVTLNGEVALRNWGYEESGTIKAHASVQRVRLADLQALAGQKYPISGDLFLNADFDGSQLHPSGSGSVRVANAQAYGESLQDVAAKFQAANGSISSSLNVASAAGEITANLSYAPATKAYKVHLDAPGITLQELKNVQEKNLPVTGTVVASVNGEGTLDDPGLSADVKFPQLQVRENTISGFRADVQIAQHQANVTLDTRVSEASIHARGTVNLAGDYETEAVIDTDTIPIEGLLAAYAPSVPQGFEGKTAVHARLKGPLKDKSRVEAHLEIPILEAKYQNLKLAISRPIKVDYANSIATLQPAEIRGTGTTLHAEGRIPVSGNSSATLSAQGSVDLQILKMVVPSLQSTGTLALDVHSSGPPTQPNVQGQLRLDNVALTTADAPIGVEQLNGVVDITGERAQITKMTARVGGGEVSVGGSVNYRPDVHFNVAVQSKSVRLRYPDGLRSLLTTNLAFSGTPQASTLNGRVLIDSLSFTSDFDLSSFADQFSSTSTPAQPGFADTVQLAVDVQSQQSLNATSSQVSIAGQATLHVGGSAANPVITGRTTLTSGELFYRNVRYALQRGVITFDDPNETHPVMNVSVTTTIEQYNLTLTLRGPLDTLTTSYVSDPPLATADIINLVARGKTTQEQAASSQSTDSMIASGVASQLSSGVQKLAGISSLQIDPTLGGSNSNPSARVAFQQRVSKNLLFSFSTDVSQPGSEIVQGEYQINKRWSVSMERDQLGGVSVDGKYHKKF